MRFKLLVAAAMLSASFAAHADSVSFTLSDPAQVGAPGTTFTFVGTIAAAPGNTGDTFLNGDAFNISGTSLTLNDTGYFSNFPTFLTPGESVTDVVFTVSSDASSSEEVNPGSFEILGGADDNTYDDLGSVNFSAQVTPEPSSIALLGTGLLGIAGVMRKRFA